MIMCSHCAGFKLPKVFFQPKGINICLGVSTVETNRDRDREALD
jgi:hypothetical protein